MRNKALERRLEDLFSDEQPLADPDRAAASLEDALASAMAEAYEPIELDQEGLGQLFAPEDLPAGRASEETSTPLSDAGNEPGLGDEVASDGQGADAATPTAVVETAPAVSPDGRRSRPCWRERLKAVWRAARLMLATRSSVQVQEGVPVAPAGGAHSMEGVPVQDETRVALQREVGYLQLGLEVAQIATLGLGLEPSLDRAVQLIQGRLGAWHAALFVLAEEGAYAIQQAVAGHADPSQAEERRLLSVAADPALAHCLASGEPWLFSRADGWGDEAGSSAAEGIVLPQSRSGVVLPLTWGDEPLGLLTLQEITVDAWSQEDLPDLGSIATQVTLLISYARASEEIEQRLRQVDALERDRVHAAWDRFLSVRSRTQHEYCPPGVVPPEGESFHEVGCAPSDLRLTSSEVEDGADGLPLVSPISLRDQVIGVLGLEGNRERPWTEDEAKVLSAVSEQLGLVLENARLFENAQQRAERERQVREITARMRESLDVETVLRVAVDEIYQALDLEEIVIQLGTGDAKRGLP